MPKAEGSQALLERLRREERAAWGIDPDGTTYIDAAERMEAVRAAYRARLAEEEQEAADADAQEHIERGVADRT